MVNIKKIPKDILIGTGILIFFTLPFYIWPIDLNWTHCLFDSSLPNPWILRSTYPWNLLYKFGTWPAMILAIGSLIIFVSGYFLNQLASFRKKSLYLVVVMILGPGIIVNLLLKDNFGRPRPRQIEEFGGNQKYYHILQPAFQEKGKSFPCGHCSMAFFFFSFYFLFKQRNKLLSYCGLAIGLFYGIMMGIARVGQGGHFPSDVLWSGGLVYLSAAILYYFVFNLDKDAQLQTKFNFSVSTKHKTAIAASGLILTFFLISGILFYLTPFDIKIEKYYSTKGIRYIHFSGNQIDYRLKGIHNDSVKINLNTNGFGFPGNQSKLIQQVKTDSLFLEHHLSGTHSEAKNFGEFIFPVNINSLVIESQNSHILIDSSFGVSTFILRLSNGNIKLKLPRRIKNKISWKIFPRGNNITIDGLTDKNPQIHISGINTRQWINESWKGISGEWNYDQQKMLISGKEIWITANPSIP